MKIRTLLNNDDKDITIAGGNITAPGDIGMAGDLTVSGNKITFGNGSVIENETDGDILAFTTEDGYKFIGGNADNEPLNLYLQADMTSPAHTAKWLLLVDSSTGVMSFRNFADGSSYSNSQVLTLAPNASGTTSTSVGVGGNLTVGADLTTTGDITINGNNLNFDNAHSTIEPADSSGTNIAGVRLALAGGSGTGSAVGGSVNIMTAPTGSSGTGVNAQQTVLGCNGDTNIGLRAAGKLYFDGTSATGHTYIVESSDDIMDIYVGGDNVIKIDEGNSRIGFPTGIDEIRTGWHGSTTRIKILPRDFECNYDAGRGALWYETNGGLQVSHANDELYAFVTIPTGYTATHARVYNNNSLTTTVYAGAIDAAFDNTSNLGSGTGQIDITDTDSTDTNYLVLQVATAATTDMIYGGYVTIAQTT